MNKTTKLTSLRFALVAAGALLASVVSSQAQNSLSATATLSDVPAGGAFDYTLTLQNTGSVNINSFWYGWIQGFFDLPTAGSNLQNVQNSLGWNAINSGNSIQFENNSGGSALTPGASMIFTFESTEIPASFVGGGPNHVGDSIAYAAASGPSTFGQNIDGVASDIIPTTPVAAPEPSSRTLLAIGCFGLTLAGWKRTRKFSPVAKVKN